MAGVIPASLEINAWTGVESPTSAVADSWRSWGARRGPLGGDQFLAAPEAVDLRCWQDPTVGWGLVLPDNDTLKPADKARGADAPPAIQRLLAARPGSPVLRYRPDGLGVKLRRYYDDGSAPDLQMSLSARGTKKNQLPRYLLIAASPQQIPWRFQYQLNVNAFTGRLDLEGIALDRYVDALIAGWPESRCAIENPLVWSVDFGAEDITRLMRQVIADPVAAQLAGDPAIRQKLTNLSGANATWDKLVVALAARNPAFILSTSHGMTGPLDDPAEMARNLGMLVDAGKGILTTTKLLARWQPDGAIWYAHACCSAGCDGVTAFQGLVPPDSSVERILLGVAALGAQTAPLPRALLGAEKPLRAFIGHVEPTFDWTLRDPENRQVLTSSLRTALYERIHQAKPVPVGMAFQQFFQEVAAIYQGWVGVKDQIADSDPELRDSAEKLAVRLKLNALDRQSFVILGDPTVALPPWAE